MLVFSCSSAFVVGSQHTHAYCIKKLFPIISVILVAQKRYLQKWSYSAAIKCIFHKLTLSTFLEISTMYGWQKWLKELISLSLLIILASNLKSSIVRAQHNIYFVFTENVNKAGSFEVLSEHHIIKLEKHFWQFTKFKVWQKMKISKCLNGLYTNKNKFPR